DFKFNVTNAPTYTVINDGEIDVEVPSGATSGFITIFRGSCSATSTNSFTVNSCNGISLHVKAFIQGYYIGGGQMLPVMFNEGVLGSFDDQVDTVTVELHSTIPGDFATIIDSYKAVMDTGGNVTGSL